MPRRTGAAEGFVPTSTYTMTIRAQYPNKPGMLGRIATTIGENGGDIGAVDIVRTNGTKIVRDITIGTRDDEQGRCILDAVRAIKGVTVRSVYDAVFLAHVGGKIEIHNKSPLTGRGDLSRVYTPGVARVCLAIKREPEAAFSLTVKKNPVAVVPDGTAVLGLGDIGPLAALPVMEGKAMLFKEFGGVDAWPICLDTKDVDAIVNTVKYLAPAFGGVNLEDISAPRCFEVEERLKKELNIPVFHDDQHGTAVVVLAAAINALKLTKRRFEETRVVINGAGASGITVGRILLSMGVRDLILCDTHGAIYEGRGEGMNPAKEEMARRTNPRRVRGDLSEAMRGADFFIGLSVAGAGEPEMVRSLAKDPIVFAMANPTPEIFPEEAHAAGAAIVE